MFVNCRILYFVLNINTENLFPNQCIDIADYMAIAVSVFSALYSYAKAPKAGTYFEREINKHLI